MQPDLNRFATEWASKGVAVIGLSGDDNEASLMNYVSQVPLTYPVGWMDALFPKPYVDPWSLPTLIVVDRNGIIVAVEVGQHSYTDLAALAEIPDHVGPPKPPPGAEPAGGG
jgi:hypothetical protein